MVAEPTVFMSSSGLVDRIPLPPAPSRRGCSIVYADRLFLKALVVVVPKCLPTVHAMLAVLAQGTAEVR